MLVQPLLGRLSDDLDARRPLMALMAILSGCAYLMYRGRHGLLAFLGLSAVGVNGTYYLTAVGGVLVGRMVSDTSRGGAAYAGYRVWGSVGYIFVALYAGWRISLLHLGAKALGRAALDPVFTYGPLLFFAIAAVALLVPDRKNAPMLTRTGVSALPAPKRLTPFLIAYFLYQFSLYGASAYLSLFLKGMHATPLQITRVFAAGVIAEVLVMMQVGRFTDRYGRRPALAVAFLLMPVRLLFYIPATGPNWVLMVQLLHGLNFGIMGAIAIVFVNDLASEQGRGTAQARLAGVGGLAMASGPAVCGWLAQQYSIPAMFAVMSAVGTAGAVVFVTQVQESHPAPARMTGPGRLQPLLNLLAAPWPRRIPLPDPEQEG
jgi:PPP family 3-phenylpropionic acid transporter